MNMPLPVMMYIWYGVWFNVCMSSVTFYSPVEPKKKLKLVKGGVV